MSRNISHYEILDKLGAGGMGEVYLTGLNNLDHFAWIGAFSSGGFPEDFNASFPALDAKASQGLHLLWIACGTEDRLIDANRKFRGWLKSKGIHLTEIETRGSIPGWSGDVTWPISLRSYFGTKPIKLQSKPCNWHRTLDRLNLGILSERASILTAVRYCHLLHR
jgi:hypothetical protein